MGWTGVIYGVLVVVIIVLKMIIASAPERKEAAKREQREKGRRDIVVGNVPNVQRRVLSILARSVTRRTDPSDAKRKGGTV